MSTRTKLIILLASAVTLPAWAQEQPATATATPETPTATVLGADPTASSVSRDKDTLSVDFPDEDIKTILRNVADLFELNLVVPDTLAGKTSIKLRDVTWRQIFKTVLDPVGFTYIEEGNIIKIVSNESLQQEPAATEVFILNNAKAADIKPTIDGLIDAAAGGKIVIDARSNALVITERPSRMGRIRSIIEKLDKATDQVMIESKFVEVNDSDIRNIGVNWASLQGMRLGVSGISQEWTRRKNQTSGDSVTNSNGSTASLNSTNTATNGTTNSTLSGTSTNTSANNTITYVTTPSAVTSTNGAFASGTMNLPSGGVTGLPSSVPSTTSVANFQQGSGTTPTTFTAPNTYNGSVTSTTSDSTSAGTSGSTSVSDSLLSSASNAINNLVSLTNDNNQSRLATAVFSSSDFNIVLSALKTQNNTKVVSNPTVVTLNNTEATINIGSEYPIPSYTYNTERGTFEVSGFQYKPIGVILKVTPQVNAQGTIRLTLEPEISSSSRETTFGGAGGASIPIIDTRKVKTQVSLKDGFTAGIGGLISSNKANGGTKVPVLGSIPVLGRLFSSKNVNEQTTNLLIFITAKTVNAEGASPEDIFTPTALESVGLGREMAAKK